jgi:hypothetical protein
VELLLLNGEGERFTAVTARQCLLGETTVTTATATATTLLVGTTGSLDGRFIVAISRRSGGGIITILGIAFLVISSGSGLLGLLRCRRLHIGGFGGRLGGCGGFGRGGVVVTVVTVGFLGRRSGLGWRTAGLLALFRVDRRCDDGCGCCGDIAV